MSTDQQSPLQIVDGSPLPVAIQQIDQRGLRNWLNQQRIPIPTGQDVTGTWPDKMSLRARYRGTPRTSTVGVALSDGDIMANTGTTQTYTLPTPAAGARVTLTNVSGTCYLSPHGSEIINGLGHPATTSTIPLFGVGSFLTVVCIDGTNWQTVDGAQDSGWIAVTGFLNSWTAGAGPVTGNVCGYRKNANVIRMGGQLGLAGTFNVQCFSMPAGYRPGGVYNLIHVTIGLGLQPTWWSFRPDGTVFINGAGNYPTLDGVTYTVD